MSLRDRVALVTGADRGIGRAIALALGRAGAHVAVGYRSRPEGGEEVVAELRSAGRRAAAVRADLADAAEVARLVREAVAAVGEIDLLVSNAGVGARVELEDLDLEAR